MSRGGDKLRGAYELDMEARLVPDGRGKRDYSGLMYLAGKPRYLLGVGGISRMVTNGAEWCR